VNANANTTLGRGQDPLKSLMESCLEWSTHLLTLSCGFLLLGLVPILGKTLLPIRMGAPGDWLAGMLVVEAAALAGIVLASRVSPLPLLSQMALIGVLGTLAILSAEAISVPGAANLSWNAALFRLVLKTGASAGLLAGLPVLLCGWLLPSQRTSVSLPLALFAAGGVCALIGYPLWIEPKIALVEQMVFWEFSVILISAIALMAGLLRMRLEKLRLEETREARTPFLPPLQATLAIGLSVATLFAATELLADELGASAFVCSIPWCLHLLVALCVYAGWVPGKVSRAGLVLLIVSLSGYLVSRGIGSAPLQGRSLLWLLLLVVSASLCGTGRLLELCRELGTVRLTLLSSTGATLGASLALLLMPRLLNWTGDILLYAGALVSLGLCELLRRQKLFHFGVVALILALPIAGVCLHQSSPAPDEQSRTTLRTRFGQLVLHQSEAGLVLSTQSTTLATQLTADKESRAVATLYASQSSALGVVISAYQSEGRPLNIGVIGLNGGTLAAYARPEDRFTFWETNPAMIRFSTEQLSYLRESRGRCDLQLANGRWGLQANRHLLDLVVINSLQGDAPPSFLLTQEALLGYSARLNSKGLIIVHSSSRYHDTYLSLWTTAQKLGMQALKVSTEVKEASPQSDYDPCASDYVIVGRPRPIARIQAFLETLESTDRVKRTILSSPARNKHHGSVWSDGINSPFPALELERLFQDP